MTAVQTRRDKPIKTGSEGNQTKENRTTQGVKRHGPYGRDGWTNHNPGTGIHEIPGY